MDRLSRHKQDIKKRAMDIASQNYGKGHNCAQSVVLACSEVLGLENGPYLINSCAGLAGGISYSGCCCGALLGGVLVIGAKYSNGSGKNRKKILKMTEKLYQKFKERFSTPCCRGLRKEIGFKDKRLFEHCRNITVETAGMVAELIAD